MRIVVDLDGTICKLKGEGQSYADVVPLDGAIEALYQLKSEGHTIIIHTARNMRTTAGNVGKVIANVGMLTHQWLNHYAVPYDELIFGKPYGDIYIDDLAHRLTEWGEALSVIRGKGESL
ncbi:HAD hydrolase family protein [Paenibacillus kobensis]|uniref:HAD hydrolase family protein n=1 Tax=Paenibacillus kobensis TaxID=59841 RepID=UPI000FDB58D6|nr:HAD hydrolase family protein [Paenibacillus kobensis]